MSREKALDNPELAEKIKRTFAVKVWSRPGAGGSGGGAAGKAVRKILRY